MAALAEHGSGGGPGALWIGYKLYINMDFE